MSIVQSMSRNLIESDVKMKNKIKKYTKVIIWILSSIIIGFLLNYYVTSEILVTYFYGLTSLYPILTVITLIIQIFVIGGIIYMIYKKNCPMYIIVLCLVLYLVVMLIILFGRSYSERIINLNIWDLFSKEAFMQNFLNFIFFIPIGYVLRKRSWISSIVCSIVFVVCIETTQWATARWIFDVVDIIVDSCAIIVGYGIFRKIYT